MKTERGFSLVELMVVISIIAVLSLVGVVVYTNVLKDSRDSKRLADLKFIQSALEDYHADQLFYPSHLMFNGGSITFGTKTYLNPIPSDPLSSNPLYSYVYITTTPLCIDNCTSYCLTAKLEGSNIPVSDPGCTAPAGYYSVARP